MRAADQDRSATPIPARLTALACVVLVALSTVLVTGGLYVGVTLTAVALWGLRFADRRWSASRWSAGAFLVMIPMFMVMIVSVVRQ
jgi:hypothetical protein